ncbi:MAG: hypothetical protein NTY46_04850 [Candidatus Sumerlaeota bacterium]|nr:hypothetical protein [Candidatus Sumerlaeota bacterium]
MTAKTATKQPDVAAPVADVVPVCAADVYRLTHDAGLEFRDLMTFQRLHGGGVTTATRETLHAIAIALNRSADEFIELALFFRHVAPPANSAEKNPPTLDELCQHADTQTLLELIRVGVKPNVIPESTQQSRLAAIKWLRLDSETVVGVCALLAGGINDNRVARGLWRHLEFISDHPVRARLDDRACAALPFLVRVVSETTESDKADSALAIISAMPDTQPVREIWYTFVTRSERCRKRLSERAA